MGSRHRLGTGPLYVLLGLLVAQIGLYQIAVPATKPADPDAVPATWHQFLEYAGLYLFYFASALALVVLLIKLSQIVWRKDEPLIPRWGFGLFGAVFAACAMLALYWPAEERAQFTLEAAFTGAILFLLLLQATGRGSLRAKIGLSLLATPFLVHFYGPLSTRWFPEMALDETLPEVVQRLGQWALLGAALASPICFAPMPILPALRRPMPMVTSVFVAFVAAFLLRRSYEVGMELASRGLGFDLGPGAPAPLIALYVVALAAATWTLVTCLTDENRARQKVGLAVGLIFAAGYAFEWPVQYMAGMVGLLSLGEAARELEEPEATTGE